MLVDNDLRLRTECQVREEHIAAIIQQQAGETQVDSYRSGLEDLTSQGQLLWMLTATYLSPRQL